MTNTPPLQEEEREKIVKMCLELSHHQAQWLIAAAQSGTDDQFVETQLGAAEIFADQIMSLLQAAERRGYQRAINEALGYAQENTYKEQFDENMGNPLETLTRIMEGGE